MYAKDWEVGGLVHAVESFRVTPNIVASGSFDIEATCGAVFRTSSAIYKHWRKVRGLVDEAGRYHRCTTCIPNVGV